MAQLHDLRLRLLVQQESERIVDSLPDGLDLSVMQARCLCWLALLLVRVVEVETAMTWPRACAELDRLHLGKFSHKDGHILQHTELTKNQRKIFKQLNIIPPPKLKSFPESA